MLGAVVTRAVVSSGLGAYLRHINLGLSRTLFARLLWRLSDPSNYLCVCAASCGPTRRIDRSVLPDFTASFALALVPPSFESDGHLLPPKQDSVISKQLPRVDRSVLPDFTASFALAPVPPFFELDGHLLPPKQDSVIYRPENN
jgi:hypothetical protein